jgi:hypothetical protein
VSKTRRESTLSPNSSMRAGCSAVVENTSTIPPRREISPGPLTMSTRR